MGSDTVYRHDDLVSTFEYYIAEAENGLCRVPRRVAADALLRIMRDAARIAELEAALSAEKAKVAEAVRELGMVADYVERHWQGAGLPLKADWIIREVSGWTTSYEQAADELEARAEAAEAEATRLRERVAELEADRRLRH